jgi:UDP-glucose 4-epimerase
VKVVAVLVTGGAGYIGSHMVHDLVDGHEEVVVLDDLSTGRRDAIPDRAELVVGGVADAALVVRLIEEHEVDAVVHFAGSIIAPESVEQPLRYYLNNTAATASLIDSSIRAGVRQLIFSSTAAVYGEPEVVPVAEDAPLVPTTPYGASKAMSETMLRDAGRAHGLAYGVLRYFNVAGADPAGRTGQSTPSTSHLIKAACEVALGLRPGLSIFGDNYPTPDGTGVRDYIHVSDLIAAHRLALQHLRSGGESFTLNCGYGTGYSVREVIAAVEAVCGQRLNVQVAPRRLGDPAMVVAKSDRIREVLGWEPEHADLQEIVRHALAWSEKSSRSEAST